MYSFYLHGGIEPEDQEPYSQFPKCAYAVAKFCETLHQKQSSSRVSSSCK